MLLLRVELPDSPGSLGAVASAMGTVGADILAVEIVERDGDRVIDDFMIASPAGAMPDSLVSVCNALEGVKVQWVSRYPEHWGLESDIDVLDRMLDDTEQAAEVLVEAAPVVFHSHWALLINRGKHPHPLFATSLAPDLDADGISVLGPLDDAHRVALGAGWLPHWPETLVALAPIRHHRAIVIGRQGGPEFLDSELARLRHLAALVP